jgi:D-2-hydroxyglutarate dehydrogenase
VAWWRSSQLGDGNLHLNVTTPGRFEVDAAVLGAIEPFVYEWVAERRGSISAEHGIGAMKPGVLHLAKSAPMIRMMRGVKALLDPHGILNPGKVLPPE